MIKIIGCRFNLIVFSFVSFAKEDFKTITCKLTIQLQIGLSELSFNRSILKEQLILHVDKIRVFVFNSYILCQKLYIR